MSKFITAIATPGNGSTWTINVNGTSMNVETTTETTTETRETFERSTVALTKGQTNKVGDGEWYVGKVINVEVPVTTVIETETETATPTVIQATDVRTRAEWLDSFGWLPEFTGVRAKPGHGVSGREWLHADNSTDTHKLVPPVHYDGQREICVGELKAIGKGGHGVGLVVHEAACGAYNPDFHEARVMIPWDLRLLAMLGITVSVFRADESPWTLDIRPVWDPKCKKTVDSRETYRAILTALHGVGAGVPSKVRKKSQEAVDRYCQPMFDAIYAQIDDPNVHDLKGLFADFRFGTSMKLNLQGWQRAYDQLVALGKYEGLQRRIARELTARGAFNPRVAPQVQEQEVTPDPLQRIAR